MSEIRAAVGALYEAFPYPSYPLFLSLRWQEGYLGSSLFAAQLFQDFTNETHAAFAREANTAGILLAGCGEALPYVIRHIEPASFRVNCVDLSQRSLRRARIRLLASCKPTAYFAADINQFLSSTTATYHHIDSYGVLHHLDQPTATVRLLANHLHANGTCRFMVYNQTARAWLIHLQKALALLKLDRFSKGDREQAKLILSQLRDLAPGIRERLTGMGPVTMMNDARFVDTFFHAWEIRYDLRAWYDLFATAGLEVMAVFDRYGELDDLPNPMWQPPSVEALSERAVDRRFENNLEIYLCKKSRRQAAASRANSLALRLQRWRLSLVRPPVLWFDYDETKEITWPNRYELWWHHVRHLTGASRTIDSLIHKLPLATAQRLARLGAILPGQIAEPGLREKLAKPLQKRMLPPPAFPKTDFAATPVAELCKHILVEKNAFTPERLAQVLRRLAKAAT